LTDFFISYTSPDRAWAEWIAWTLEEAGYTTVIQAWDFRPGSNFALEMQSAAATAERTIAVFSPDYFASRFSASEWAAAFASDPDGLKRKLIPVRIRECREEGLLKQVVHIDLTGLDEITAKRHLVMGIKPGRAKPDAKPTFPGAEQSGKSPAPAFPGTSGQSATGPPEASGYKLKIRGLLTDVDKRRFLKEAFEIICNRFETSLAELVKENANVEMDFTRVDTTKFTAEIFVNGQSRTRCKIWQGGMFGSGGISYGEGHSSFSENTCNEVLTLSRDDRDLALGATMNMGLGRTSDGLNPEKMSAPEAAEYLWRRFCWGLER
jgi:hypothetical protein